MSVRFAPPSLLRARAVHARGDRWIADGAHLRVQVSSLLGFPLHPFAAWRLEEVSARGTEPRALSGGQAVGLPAEFQPERPLTLLPPGAPWVYLEAEAEGLVVILEAVAAVGGRTLGQRIGEPFAVAGFDLGAVRVLGNNGLLRSVRAVERPQVDEGIVDSGASFTFGLPVEDSPWYAQAPGGMSPAKRAQDRLTAGASAQTGPAEAPDRQFKGLDAGADAELVLGHLAPEHLDRWIDQAWGQDAQRPAEVRVTVVRDPDDQVTDALPEGVETSVALAPADALMTVSADPRIGRYTGLVTTDPQEVAERGPRPAIWLVVAQWAVRADPGSPLDRLLDSADAPGLNYGLEREFPGLSDVRQRWLEARPGGPWRAVTLATLACAALEAPFDLPLAAPVAGPSWWSPSRRGRWVQRIELPGDPTGTAAFARIDPDVVRLNPIQDTGFGERALGLVPQYRRPTGTSAGGGALLDGDVDGEVEVASWQVALADDVGRWGEPTRVDELPRPPRPLPGPPGLEAVPVAPGVLHVRVEVPGPDEQPPGAPEVVEVGLVVEGQEQPSQAAPAPARPPTPLTWEVPIELDVGEEREVAVQATLVTAEPPPFRTASRAVTMRDGRVAPPPPTGPELVWTSAADPGGRAELGLQWPPAPRTRYRVYLGDERVLASALGRGVDPAQPRERRAAALLAEAGRLTDKSLFALLTDEPLGPDGDGVVRFRHPLPGALRDVQFARVVAVSEQGHVEAPFADAGLVPIAVPLVEVPPPPTLRLQALEGGVRLSIEARGIRADVLSLLASGATGCVPQVRLRRALGRVAEVESMLAEPTLAEPILDLHAPTEEGGPWTTSVDVDDAQLPAFVRALWVAQVRYPAEPGLEPGAQPTPIAGRVSPLEVAAGTPRELPWSAPSLSASTMRVPPGAPGAPSGATATSTPTGARITLPQVPAAHPRSAGAWTLLVVRHAGGASVALAPIDLAGRTAPVIVETHLPTDAFTLALVDPLGRVGAPAEVAVS